MKALLVVLSALLPFTTQANEISACVDNKGDITDVTVDGIPVCKNDEQVVTWNIIGPQGPVGPMGPMGPQGPAGPPGADADTTELEARLAALEGAATPFCLLTDFSIEFGDDSPNSPAQSLIFKHHMSWANMDNYPYTQFQMYFGAAYDTTDIWGTSWDTTEGNDLDYISFNWSTYTPDHEFRFGELGFELNVATGKAIIETELFFGPDEDMAALRALQPTPLGKIWYYDNELIECQPAPDYPYNY